MQGCQVPTRDTHSECTKLSMLLYPAHPVLTGILRPPPLLPVGLTEHCLCRPQHALSGTLPSTRHCKCTTYFRRNKRFGEKMTITLSSTWSNTHFSAKIHRSKQDNVHNGRLQISTYVLYSHLDMYSRLKNSKKSVFSFT